jgi:hypothetical protein
MPYLQGVADVRRPRPRTADRNVNCCQYGCPFVRDAAPNDWRPFSGRTHSFALWSRLSDVIRSLNDALRLAVDLGPSGFGANGRGTVRRDDDNGMGVASGGSNNLDLTLEWRFQIFFDDGSDQVAIDFDFALR